MEKYNLKIKEYNNQVVTTFYNNPVCLKDKLENVIIQLKKFRTEHSELMLDYGNGTALYGCPFQTLENEINEVLFDEDLEQFKTYIKGYLPYVYVKDIVTDEEKQEKSFLTSLNRTKNKVYDLAYSNDWDLFITLTFDDSKLLKKYNGNATDYDVCVKALHSFFTVLKRQFKDIQYIGVPELHHTYYNAKTSEVVIYKGEHLTEDLYFVILHKKNKTKEDKKIIKNIYLGKYKRRFHFHFLFNNYPLHFLKDSSLKDSKGHIIYNLTNYKLGFTTATLVDNVAASQVYITKYITKDLIAVTKGKKRYWASKNLNKPTENNYYLLSDEYADLKQDIELSVKSDTRKKDIKLEVKGFSNDIYKYVSLDSEILESECLENYINLSDRYYIFNNSYHTLELLESYFNSAFCPFYYVTENNDLLKKPIVNFICKGKFYKAKLQNGIYKIIEC